MIKETLIFGHKNPDTDSITSSLVMENLEKNQAMKMQKQLDQEMLIKKLNMY